MGESGGTMLEFDNGVLHVNSFLAVTFGIFVLFVGKRLNDAIGVLREFSIPEPVTGGLLLSVIATLIYALTGVGMDFELGARDFLLVYFFTTIGINASVSDLLAGGKPLVILLAVTIAYMVLQDVIGISLARALEQPPAVGLLGGTVSLIGGHGTAIAWAPRISEGHGGTERPGDRPGLCNLRADPGQRHWRADRTLADFALSLAVYRHRRAGRRRGGGRAAGRW